MPGYIQSTVVSSTVALGSLGLNYHALGEEGALQV